MLAEAYSEPERKFHTMNHLRECFKFYDSLPYLPGKTARTEMALWFHDTIYKMVPTGNEEASAKWAKYFLMDAGVFEGLATQIADLIIATKHGAEPVSPEGKLLADVDLWILAATPERFKEYDEVQIRAEYAKVPDEVFYPTRARIMGRLAEKEHIYYAPEIRSQLEDRARANLSKYSTSNQPSISS